MIPKSLTIKGFLSYRETQTIDFERLNAAHLFGIFGRVGSGKSAILEAILFALFRKNRITEGSNFKHNMTNLQSRELLIDFVFESNDTRYQVVVKGKRKEKTPEEFTNFEHKFYRFSPENVLIPLDSFDPKREIGLDYEDFKKTVIIPQNEFQAFLEMETGKRSEMIGKLFNLHHFDLAPKLRVLEEKNTIALETVRAELAHLAQVTPEAMESVRVEMTQLVAENDREKQQLDAQKRAIDRMTHVQKVTQELAKAEQNHASFAEKSAEMALTEQKLAQYERVLSIFQPILTTLEGKRNEWQLAENEFIALEKAAQKTADEIEKLNAQLGILTPQYEGRDALKQRAQAISKAIEAKALAESLARFEASFQRGQSKIAKTEAERRQLEAEKQKISAERAAFYAQKPDFEELDAVAAWFSDYQKMREKTAQQETDCNGINEKVRHFLKRKFALLRDNLPPLGVRLDPKMPISDAFLAVKSAIATAKSRRNALSDAIKRIEHVASLVVDLAEGQPCPVCGATDHPSVLSTAEHARELETLQTQLKTAENRLSALENVESELKELLSGYNTRTQDRREALFQLRELRLREKTHRDAFKWPKFHPHDFEGFQKQRTAANAFSEKLNDFNQNMTQLDAQLSDTDAQSRDFQQKLNELYARIAAERARSAAALEAIGAIDLDWQNTDDAELKNIAQALDNQYVEIEKNFQNTQQLLQNRQSQAALLRGQLAQLEKQKNVLTEAIAQQEKQLTAQLTASAFETRAQIESILAEKRDVAAQRREIDAFKQSKVAAEAAVNHWRNQLDGAIYDPNAHAALTAGAAVLQQKIEENGERISNLKARLLILENDFKKRQTLDNQKVVLEDRAANIATLKSLFRDKGFLKFAATMHLQNICHTANKRFKLLTRGHLMLALNAKNDFVVCDLLNRGLMRDTATLSGGQKFQASLSLALALSDNIQEHLRSKNRFFFLDEGFGSLDKESLQVVFDTLKDLRRENRIVGVISHVEEMQQEIDHYVQVYFDEERGSSVQIF